MLDDATLTAWARALATTLDTPSTLMRALVSE